MWLAIGIVIVIFIIGWIRDHAAELAPLGYLVAAIGVSVPLIFWLARRQSGPNEPEPVLLIDAEPVKQGTPEIEARSKLLAGEVLLADRLHAPILLRYRDFEGRMSERTVDVKIVGGRRTRGRGTYLSSMTGFCQLRQEIRTFKGSGVQAAFDPRSGEEIANLGAYLLNKPELILGDPPPPPSAAKRKNKGEGAEGP